MFITYSEYVVLHKKAVKEGLPYHGCDFFGSVLADHTVKANEFIKKTKKWGLESRVYESQNILVK